MGSLMVKLVQSRDLPGRHGILCLNKMKEQTQKRYGLELGGVQICVREHGELFLASSALPALVSCRPIMLCQFAAPRAGLPSNLAPPDLGEKIDSVLFSAVVDLRQTHHPVGGFQ